MFITDGNLAMNTDANLVVNLQSFAVNLGKPSVCEKPKTWLWTSIRLLTLAIFTIRTLTVIESTYFHEIVWRRMISDFGARNHDVAIR